MKKPEIPANENLRQQALDKYGIVDTAPEGLFDDITLLACNICQTPVALISLIDHDRQWFKSRQGLTLTETPRDLAFCAHAILSSKTFLVGDASLDPRFADHPMVAAPSGVRFYAGAPLTTADGFNLGTLCVVDTKPRQLDDSQTTALEALSRTTVALFEQHRKRLKDERDSRFLHAVMDSLPSVVSYLDNKGCYQFTNDAFRRWFGIDTKSIVGKTPREVFGEETYLQTKPYMDKALQGEYVELQRRLPYQVDGIRKHKHVRSNYIPDRDSTGTVCGFFAISTDLTVEVEAQEALVANEREFQRVFDAVPAMIGHWDLELRNISANQAYISYFQRNPHHIKGMHIREMFGEEMYALNTPYLEGVLRGEPQKFERRVNATDGKARHILVEYLPDFDQGKVIGFFVVANDVTTLKNFEDERRWLEAKIVASNKMAELGEMAGGIAHEINTPLGIIMGKSENLRELAQLDKLEKPVLIDELLRIELTTERIAKIIRGLRAFSRSGEQDSVALIRLQVLVENVLELCRERFGHSGVRLTVKGVADIEFECRESQVAQILLNLLNNAFDVASELADKWIELEAVLVDSRVFIYITDSGLGVPAAVVSKMMQPFFTTKEVGKGTGLGLSISLGLAQGHGGALYYVDGRPNTTFCLELPIRQAR